MIKRKSYDKEFKLEAVRLVESGKKVAEVARELDLAEQTLQKKRKEKLVGQIKQVHLESRRICRSPKITKQLNSEILSVRLFLLLGNMF